MPSHTIELTSRPGRFEATRRVALWTLAIAAVFALQSAPPVEAAGKKKLLIIAQSRDNHPPKSHEFAAGAKVLSAMLAKHEDLDVTVTLADGAWKDGPQLIDKADGVVIFLSEGGKWMHQDPRRKAALERLTARGGGVVGLHWGVGTKPPQFVPATVALFGGCHGGPDRKYIVLETRLTPTNHEIARGVKPLKLHDEFYYTLKFAKQGKLAPVATADIKGVEHVVAWAWTRPDGGRSFGFTGLHFHKNWARPEIRRMVVGAVAWTLKRSVPESGFDVSVSDKVLTLPPEPAKKDAKKKNQGRAK